MTRFMLAVDAIVRSMIFWYGLAITATYFAVATIVPAYVMIEILNAMFLGTAVAVTIVYYPLLADMLTVRRYDRISQLALGIIVHWASSIITRIYSTTTRTLHGSENMTSNHAVVGYCILLLVISGYLQATARTFDMKGDVYVRDNKRVAYAMFAGLVIGGISLLLQRYGLDWIRWPF